MTVETQSENRAGRLYVISAPSGGGKTSLTRAVIERLGANGRVARFSVSYTTRNARAGEVDGVDYHFVSRDEFEAMAERGEFLEYARVFDRYYGTSAAETARWLDAGQDVVLDIDWQGAAQVRERAPQAITIFIRPPSREELERRLRARGSEDEVAIQRRLAEADDELAHADDYDYQIVNDRFEHALDELTDIFERTV
ncbi:guanylate kinase [Salinisphaera hydrothermalis]|uniref:Guanylate kinase n=1 Tax=Salinisphaera hydrothermalis (strain C41B8) TaxID=1304275 RepID=A0A084IR91_SALHC|nr:guanylate kinase [Salinisphaera hydrothermalis]KEZ79225.1 guanylate kinase [Salinisphaera hydrothermalis C41B8]